MYDFFKEDEFILELIDFAMAYDMALGDIFHYAHWGVVMRDGKETPVLMDYGLNKQDFKYHYDANIFGATVKKKYRHGKLT
jgi:hypothetical protein